MEEWRDIEGYKGKYQVSNTGKVKSLNYNHTGKERILKAYVSGQGYLKVKLYQDGKIKHCYVHRLVAVAFLENPEGYTEVNHKDEDKTNNCVENLEYCSRSYNNRYNDKAKKAGKKISEKMTNNPKLSKPVQGIDRLTGEIKEFPSAHEAERQMDINYSDIIKCCKGRHKSAGGYTWHYVDSEEVCDE